MKKLTKAVARAPRGRGTVSIIAALFIASAVLRLTTSVDVVFAAANEDSAMEEPKDMDSMSSEVMHEPTSREISRLLKAIEERESKVLEKELQIEKRMKALRVADDKIRERLAELRVAEEELRSTLALASTAAEDDLLKLTAVYENMKPKTAAKLFEEMAPDFAAGFLGRMKPGSAAAIMAGMAPEKAYAISAILAGRNANVPKK